MDIPVRGVGKTPDSAPDSPALVRAWLDLRNKGAEYYQAAKILMVDDHGVHIRLYSNCWPSPPERIDVSTLILDSEGPGQALGIGHLPFTTKAFLAQGPVAFQQSTVTEEELDGYQIWQQDQGGYFAS